MHWQDPVLTAAQILFILALFPSILSKDKPALATCIVNALVAALIAGVYGSLSLWFASSTAGMNSIMWCVLAVQKQRQKHAIPSDVP